MKRNNPQEEGQALFELVLALFLFVLFVQGVVQLVMIGSAQIRLLEAARQGAWVRNRWNNASLQDSQFQTILPGITIEKISGASMDEGLAYRFTYTVPALGFFRSLKPQGFTLTTRSAVAAHVGAAQERGKAREIEQARRILGR